MRGKLNLKQFRELSYHLEREPRRPRLVVVVVWATTPDENVSALRCCSMLVAPSRCPSLSNPCRHYHHRPSYCYCCCRPRHECLGLWPNTFECICSPAAALDIVPRAAPPWTKVNDFHVCRLDRLVRWRSMVMRCESRGSECCSRRSSRCDDWATCRSMTTKICFVASAETEREKESEREKTTANLLCSIIRNFNVRLYFPTFF